MDENFRQESPINMFEFLKLMQASFELLAS